MLSIRFNSLHASKLRSNAVENYVQIPGASRNPSSCRIRVGCRILRKAFASIWRIRSRVTWNCSAYFFQRSAVAVDETESLLEDLPFSVRERFQDILDFFLEQNDRSHVARIFGAPVLDEIAKVGFLALAYR